MSLNELQGPFVSLQLAAALHAPIQRCSCAAASGEPVCVCEAGPGSASGCPDRRRRRVFSPLPPLPCRDVDEEEKGETPWAQQEAFEAEQIKKAGGGGGTRFGAKDRKSKAGEACAAPRFISQQLVCACRLPGLLRAAAGNSGRSLRAVTSWRRPSSLRFSLLSAL